MVYFYFKALPSARAAIVGGGKWTTDRLHRRGLGGVGGGQKQTMKKDQKTCIIIRFEDSVVFRYTMDYRTLSLTNFVTVRPL